MAFPIIPIRNAVATSEIAPLSGALQLGELAINTQTSKLYVKNNAGTVVEIGAGATGITTSQLACLTTTATPNLVPQLLPSGFLALAQINALTTAQMGCLTTSAVAGLVPQLGSDGKIAVAQLPAAAIGGLTYKGAWTVNSSPVIASGGDVGGVTAAKGDYYIAANSAALDPAIDGQTYVQAGDMIAYNGAGSWDFIDGAKSEVRSVNNISPTAAGNVVLTAANVGALSTDQITQLAIADKIPQLNANGQIATVQLQIATTSQLGVLSIDSAASNGLFISGAGAAKIIPGTSTVVGGVKSSTSIAIAEDGTATVQGAGTY
jgi:hypothetical protein